jgi:magnesium-protoporphyrin IX monomethyl ester (oxidative) cyclase
MNKVLLISPPEQHMLAEAGDRPPLGALYVAGNLRKEGISVMVSDLNHDDYHEFQRKLHSYQPTHIGMSFSTPYFNWATNFQSWLREHAPAAYLIAGGPHPSADPESCQGMFDYVVQGEGEVVTPEIVKGNRPKGIIRAEPIRDLDRLPFPARDMVEMSRYRLTQEGKLTATVMSSRACPASCFFCGKTIFGKKYRVFSPERFVDELESVHHTYGFNHFYFLDDTFTFDKDHIRGVTAELFRRNLRITFRAISRTDGVDKETLQYLQAAGMSYISFGLEHADNTVLGIINKGTTVEKHATALQHALDLGIPARGSFIVNLPGATEETVMRTLEFAKRFRLEHADFYPLIAYPGTPLWDNPEKFGVRITSREYGVYQSLGKTNVETDTMTKEQAEGLVARVRKEWARWKHE